MKKSFFNRRHTIRIVTFLVLICIIFPTIVLARDEKCGENKVSALGEYRGYSQPIYDGYQRFSQYIIARDGTKLAVDILRPTKNGNLAVTPLPVVWTHNRYHRANAVNGIVIPNISKELLSLIQYGYIIGNADMRGSGASFGVCKGPLLPVESFDAYDITEWFARQPWCNGNIGMCGYSYPAMAEYMAAGQMPPHLKAIMPEMGLFDLYGYIYPNGIYHGTFMQNWQNLIHILDCGFPAAPVDEDPLGVSLQVAMQEHQGNADMYGLLSSLPYRNSYYGEYGDRFYQITSPYNYLEQIEKSGVAVYHVGGWYDSFMKEPILFYNNLKKNQKLMIGPWPHQLKCGFDWTAEYLRWFDYWLKGIDNNIMKEPSIFYYTMSFSKGKGSWKKTHTWPLPDQVMTKFYLQSDTLRRYPSVKGGALSEEFPFELEGIDQYQVNYATTTGNTSRWSNGCGGVFAYPNMAGNDSLGLTYTSGALNRDVEITGHPIIHLWVTSTAYNGDFFVYLEDVAKDGSSKYITEGALRASHRALSPPPYNNLGLPYHRGNREDLTMLPNVPVELNFDLIPTSYIFEAGHRIRITITGADFGNYETPQLNPAPIIRVYHNRQFASYVELPFIPANHGQHHQTNIDSSRMESYLHDKLQKVQICGTLWNGEPTKTFSVVVQELLDQDYRHLVDFYNSSDKRFTLQAPGYPDVNALVNGALTTYGLGGFQGFQLVISPDELAKLASGVQYTLHPQNGIPDFQWVILDGVTVSRP